MTEAGTARFRPLVFGAAARRAAPPDYLNGHTATSIAMNAVIDSV